MWKIPIVNAIEKSLEYIVSDVVYEADKANSISKHAEKAINILNSVQGIFPCHDRDFKWSRPIFVLKDGTVVKICKNGIGLDHMFLADNNGKLIYGGFVGWKSSNALKEAIEKIRNELS